MPIHRTIDNTKRYPISSLQAASKKSFIDRQNSRLLEQINAGQKLIKKGKMIKNINKRP